MIFLLKVDIFRFQPFVFFFWVVRITYGIGGQPHKNGFDASTKVGTFCSQKFNFWVWEHLTSFTRNHPPPKKCSSDSSCLPPPPYIYNIYIYVIYNIIYSLYSWNNLDRLYSGGEHKTFSQLLVSYQSTIAGWWFQPIWQILVKIGIFPK